MEVINIDLSFMAKEPSVIALGNFDGLHKGHLTLLQKAIQRSRELNIKSSVLLFTEHTDNLISFQKKEIIITNRIKMKLLEEIGIDLCYVIDFTPEFMNIEPLNFLIDFLKNKLQTVGIVVGYDYTYGYRAKGDSLFLLKNKESFDTVDIIDPVTYNGIPISSTMIREFIRNGEIETANRLLTRPYRMTGYIVHGKKLGTKMGYPTANVQLDDHYVIPKFGVYDTNITVKGQTYRAATNVGVNPTVDFDGIKIESHILDFNEDIYRESIILEFLSFLRPETVFDSVSALFQQIERDIQQIRQR
ncbi:MAG: bifunctional riboflavin kinase/FAD synthetase [Tissierellia bacterium]|nr:bifunctional riboflavin kinase/FAD synthetase [Tissierellia bacterium]